MSDEEYAVAAIVKRLRQRAREHPNVVAREALMDAAHEVQCNWMIPEEPEHTLTPGTAGTGAR